ncbi:ferredoxin [Patescibacteria group bacterium]
MKIKIDQNLCIGCGACVSLCPDVFELKEDGKANVKDEKACEKCDCKRAKEACPVQAISIEME